MSDVNRLHEVSRALAATRDLGELTRTVTTSGLALFGADAACTYVRRADGRLEMLAHRGCTPRFLTEWRFIPAGCLSLAIDGVPDQIFLGTPAEFKGDAPGSDDLVDHSGRQVIGYAPLSAAGRLLGVFGFSYNEVPRDPPDADLARAFASVAALALTRFYSAPSTDSPLSLVPDSP